MKKVQDIVMPNIQKHESYVSIDSKDLEYGIFLENSEDENDE